MTRARAHLSATGGVVDSRLPGHDDLSQPDPRANRIPRRLGAGVAFMVIPGLTTTAANPRHRLQYPAGLVRIDRHLAGNERATRAFGASAPIVRTSRIFLDTGARMSLPPEQEAQVPACARSQNGAGSQGHVAGHAARGADERPCRQAHRGDGERERDEVAACESSDPQHPSPEVLLPRPAEADGAHTCSPHGDQGRNSADQEPTSHSHCDQDSPRPSPGAWEPDRLQEGTTVPGRQARMVP